VVVIYTNVLIYNLLVRLGQSSCHNREVKTLVVHVSATIGRVVASRYKSSVKTKPVREPTIVKPSNTTIMVSKRFVFSHKTVYIFYHIAGNIFVNKVSLKRSILRDLMLLLLLLLCEFV